jgi:hypothetical protein
VGTILAGLFKDLRQLGMSDTDNGVANPDEGDQFLVDLMWAGVGLCMLLIVQIVNDVLIFHQYDNVSAARLCSCGCEASTCFHWPLRLTLCTHTV